jgi:K+-sensing histidine kinase KdpD
MILKNNMKISIPFWVKTGILIIPFLIIIGIILHYFSKGTINSLFWLVIPAVIFEELFETCCYNFSNNQTGNLFFVLLFWFTIGAIIGIINKLKYKLN